MNIEERKRYDRQVRLWGKATQEQLRQTEVYVNGITSATAEITKNLVLAGVCRVVVNDESNIEDGDVSTSFLVQNWTKGETRGEVSVRRLGALNPYVDVSLATQIKHKEMLSTQTSFIVSVSYIQGSNEALWEYSCAQQNVLADLLVFVIELGHITMGLFLSKKQKLPYKEQLDLLLTKNTSLRPTLFQLSLLLMRMEECHKEATYFERLVFARDIIIKYGLSQLKREDIEYAVGFTPKHHSVNAIDATVAGGIFAQLIIGKLSSGNKEEEGNEGYAWAICDNSCGTNVQVGPLFVP
ncbi:ubiquitin activating enzyme [Trypanosoma theileri]|uniref:Ubiquitin activating enzyme n=1 Tax=Trypanosoma theileri TaxID=67003 RepID=A0A1X0NVF2_9TRYP|nr:ubiquitin activating enzyme [Trypanosoma theileri]ORC88667.1 ubiquitin activating enzyme [Trypanosoma theileri]